MTSLSVTFWSGIESRSAGCVDEERGGEKEFHSKLETKFDEVLYFENGDVKRKTKRRALESSYMLLSSGSC
jgi:hypothetical protein